MQVFAQHGVDITVEQARAPMGLMKRDHLRQIARMAPVAAQWQAWSYAVLLLAGVRTWGLSESPLRPPGRWWGGAGRWSLGTLWRGYRQALWGVGAFRALSTATGADWWTKADQLAGLQNAVSAAQRA